MFDLSWGEVMVIGAVALIVIGPKDLPKALRTVGNMTAKVRRMAGEFQSQFNDAMREAELDEIRKQVEGVNQSVAGFNPMQTVRDELKGAIEAPAGAARHAVAGAVDADHDAVPPADQGARPAIHADIPPPEPLPAPIEPPSRPDPVPAGADAAAVTGPEKPAGGRA